MSEGLEEAENALDADCRCPMIIISIKAKVCSISWTVMRSEVTMRAGK